MRKTFILLLFSASTMFAQGETTPAMYWNSLNDSEKIAFVNGAYASMSSAKMHHQREVTKQYKGVKNWLPPYYIDRYYEIIDEHISTEAGMDLGLITGQLDALYSNFDNQNIPLIEAIRIVSIAQDGDRQKANLLLLKAQRGY